MRRKNRKHSIIDRLPLEIKETVDEMVKADFTYRDIVDYIKSTGTQISIASVGRYAANLNETIQSLRMAQENFKAIMEETSKYPNLDVTDAIIRLLSNQMLEAINNTPEEDFKKVDVNSLMKNVPALGRAAAYKTNMDLKNKDILSAGFEQVKTLVFEAMAKERPELYEEVRKYLKDKEDEQ